MPDHDKPRCPCGKTIGQPRPDGVCSKCRAALAHGNASKAGHRPHRGRQPRPPADLEERIARLAAIHEQNEKAEKEGGTIVPLFPERRRDR